MPTLKTEELILFNKLYEEYHMRFVRFANTYVRNDHAAEDIVSEAFMRYWENRHTIENDSSIPGYILTVIKHKSLNYLRHESVHDEYSEHLKDYYQWELNSRISTLQGLEPSRLFTDEMLSIVKSTLNSLPDQTRKIFMMSRYENKTYKEIAEELNITTKGVEFHMGKAFKALRIALKDYFLLFFLFFLESN